MSLDNITSITDITDAIKALSEKTSALESELSVCQSEVSRLNRVNSRLLADNTKLEKLVRQLESEIEKLGGKRVEKDSTNSSIRPLSNPLRHRRHFAPARFVSLPAGRAADSRGMRDMSWLRRTLPPVRKNTRQRCAPTVEPSLARTPSRYAP